jgi:hypothetical protein
MNYKSTFILTLTILFCNVLAAQSNSEMRSFMKTVHAGKETSLEVSNKYGTVQITPWNKDSVSVRAEVKAFASSQSKLGKMFDGITVNISETSYLIRAQTDFTQNISMLFENFKGMTSKLISYDSRVEINYFISVPEYLNLKIENKYGDVIMENSTGNVSVSVSNGSFKANSLGKGSTLTLSFCDASINSIVSGKIEASFSEISIGESGDLSINSISSRYEIKKTGMIRTESRRDKFFITSIESLQGNSYFTDFNFDKLNKEINLTSRYGNLNIDLVGKGFELIDINSGYSDISIGFDPSASYNLDIRHINAFVVLSGKDTKTERKSLDEEKKEYMTYGTVGKNPGTTKVKIDATRGNIYLK